MIDSGFHCRFRLSRKNSENTQICIFYDLLAISRKRKELSEIHWWRNNRNFGAVSRNADCDNMCDTSVQKSVFWSLFELRGGDVPTPKLCKHVVWKRRKLQRCRNSTPFGFMRPYFPGASPSVKRQCAVASLFSTSSTDSAVIMLCSYSFKCDIVSKQATYIYTPSRNKQYI